MKLTNDCIFQCHVDHIQKHFIPSNVIADTVLEEIVFTDYVTQNDNVTGRYPVRDRCPSEGTDLGV